MSGPSSAPAPGSAGAGSDGAVPDGADQDGTVREFASLAEVSAAAGQVIGTSPWLAITQDRIDTFAQATGDHQWIHVDAARAATGPFGTTIAHGYLTLSLLSLLGTRIFHVDPAITRINYGVNSVRFINPVPVDSRVRAVLRFGEVSETAQGLRVPMNWVVQIDGADKPAAVAETITLMLSPA